MDLSVRMEACNADSKKVPTEEQVILTQEPPWSTTKSKDTKEVEHVIGDRSKMAQIGAHLNLK